MTASETERLSWRIEKLVPGTDQGDLVDFGLFVTGDLKWVVFTYGNNDIGCDIWRQSMLKARVFQTAFLNLPDEIEAHRTAGWQINLSTCIRELMKEHPPNEWGYT